MVDAPIVSHSIGWSAGTGEPQGGMRFISCLGASIRPRARRPGARGGTGSRRRAKCTSGTEIPLDRSDRDRPSTVPTPGRKLWKTTVCPPYVQLRRGAHSHACKSMNFNLSTWEVSIEAADALGFFDMCSRTKRRYLSGRCIYLANHGTHPTRHTYPSLRLTH